MLKFSLRTIYCGYITCVPLLINNLLWVFLEGNSLCSWLFVFALLLHGFSFPCCFSQTIIFTSFLPITATQNVLCQYFLFAHYWVNQLWSRNFVHPQPFGILWQFVISLLIQEVCTLTFNTGLSEIDAMMRTGWLWCRTALSSDSVMATGVSAALIKLTCSTEGWQCSHNTFHSSYFRQNEGASQLHTVWIKHKPEIFRNQ